MSPGSVSRVVLITGCSSGIGHATALRLRARDWRVYATARDVRTLDHLKAAGCHVLALDVTDEAAMQAAVEHVTREAGGIGALVNNAGYSQSGAFEMVPLSRVRAQFETNVFGLVRLTQLVLPGMRARRCGRIVTIGSMGGRLTFPGSGFYHATKHALEALTDALRFETAGFGIKVVLIQPGLVRTAFTKTVTAHVEALESGASGPYGHFTSEVERITRESYEKGPVGRLTATADEVAATIEEALTTMDPRPRYRVGWSATVFMTLRALVPDRVWDALLARTYPRPGDRSGP
ncbi:MAG: SDR family NAD(P)-dependent oxidoreductase [Acidobacteria bacterium]|nr:SDR family NAD(P)-dependent oxidoreductase [Acidobacteriota bacterium]